MSSRANSSGVTDLASALLYSVDQEFLPLACISIASIAENRKDPIPPVSILLHEVDKPSRYCAERFLEKLGIEFHLIDVDGGWCEPWASKRRQSPSKFGVLRMEEFLRHSARRVLIIDADTRFVDDIGPLLNMPLDSASLAATDDIAMIADGRVPTLANKLGLPPGTGYFNSGLMVVDLDRWTSEQIGRKAIAVFTDRPEILTFNDQCALNAVLQGRYKKLGFRWNHLVGSSPPGWPASMFHYAGHLKPWQLGSVRRFWPLDHLVPREHFDYYDRMCQALQWTGGAVGRPRYEQVVLMNALFIKLGFSGRFRRYSERQTSTRTLKIGSEHPELLT